VSFCEFKEYLKAEGIIQDEEDAKAYMSIFFDRGYDMENLDDDLYRFAGFLSEAFRKLYGENMAKDLWFLIDIDHASYKYNKVRVTRTVRIGKYEYDVEINAYDCKWGTVAENPDDFNQQVERFLKDTRNKLENLLTSIQ
jgi:hypothetical protein